MSALINSISYSLRSLIKWSNGFTQTRMPKKQFDYENRSLLVILSHLETFLKEENINLKKFKKPIITDVGCKSFLYSKTYHEFYKKFWNTPEAYSINGVEVDPWRLLAGFKSRYDFGKEMELIYRGVAYHPIDFCDYAIYSEFIFILFPFVTKKPLLNWGLPVKLFDPEKLFEHTYFLLKSQGVIVLVHHGKEEKNASDEIWKKMGHSVSWAEPFPLEKWSNEIYLGIIQK